LEERQPTQQDDATPAPRIAQQSYLLVTEDDFAKAAGLAKVMAEG
jgi:hypothetical protein